jgi:O-antigen ligase
MDKSPPSVVVQNLESAVAILTCLWLLSSYVLPNTLLATLSPLTYVSIPAICTRYSDSRFFGIVIVTLVCAYLWTRTATRARVLWGATSLYGGIYAVQAILIRQQDVSRSADCLAVVLALSIGLVCARLCEKSSVTAAAISLIGAIQATYTIIYFAIGVNSMTSGVVRRAGGTFGGPDYVYSIMLFCLPLSIALAAQAPRRTRIMWAICGSLQTLALIFTWYRGGLLGMAFGGSWMAFRLIQNRRIAVVVSLALFSLFALSVIVRTDGTVNRLSSNRSLVGRTQLWRSGWGAFLHRPITGVGAAGLRIQVRQQDGAYSEYRQPLNVEIQWLAEMGAPGGVLLLFFAWNITRIVRRSSEPIAIGIGGAWLALFVAGQTDTSFCAVDRISSFALTGALLGATIMLNSSERLLGNNLDIPA